MIELHDVLLARRDARTPVCRDGADTLDFSAFLARVGSIAVHLSEPPAQRYALCIDDPFNFACALFALFACGKEAVIPAHAAPGYLADLSNAYDAVLTDADMPARVSSSEYLGYSASIDPHAPLTLYTSGSSGTPKPIRKTLAQFNAEVHTLETQWGTLVGDATVLGSVPHHHIYGLLFRVFWPIATGRAFDRALSMEPQHLQARIAQCGTGSPVVVSTPAQLSRWPELDGFTRLSPPPRVFFSSGGPLAADAASKYAAAFGSAPVEIYGSTETGGIAWRRQDQTDAWQALNGVEVQRGDDGALNLRSPHLGHGDWHRTDDTVAFDTDGRFRLQGRLDRVTKLDGKRVSLPELESRLGLHPYVAQAAVVLLEGMSRERVGAVVALTVAGSEALLERGRVALARILRRHLAAYFDIVVLPRFWRFRFALPFDARGKLPAAAVAAAFDARPDGVEVLSEARSGTAMHYELRVPPTLVHFAGHFPGLPILPGVVQIDWAMRLAAEQVPGVRMLASVEQLKFKAPVPPGALLDLTLTHDASRRRVQFMYRLGERECTSGAIVYRGGA